MLVTLLVKKGAGQTIAHYLPCLDRFGPQFDTAIPPMIRCRFPYWRMNAGRTKAGRRPCGAGKTRGQ